MFQRKQHMFVLIRKHIFFTLQIHYKYEYETPGYLGNSNQSELQ